MSAEKRQRGRPAMFTDHERLQRKREMARLRQARKRARDRERQSLGRDSLGSGIELDSADIPEGKRSESGDHSPLIQGTEDELDEDEVVGKGQEIMGFGQIGRPRENSAGESPMLSHKESKGKGVEVAPQPLVVSGIGPMQLHPDHEMQGIPTRAGTTPNIINIHPQERIPTIYDHPRISEDIAAEIGDTDEASNNHAIIWPWLRRAARLIESSCGDRKMQEDIYTILYTNDMVRLLYEWENACSERPLHQSELKEQVSTESELRAKGSFIRAPVAPLGLHGEEDKESTDEVMDELLGHLEERVQAIRKQRGLKAEVQSLKRDLINKERQLQEYNAIVDSERTAWQAERAEMGR